MSKIKIHTDLDPITDDAQNRSVGEYLLELVSTVLVLSEIDFHLHVLLVTIFKHLLHTTPKPSLNLGKLISGVCVDLEYLEDGLNLFKVIDRNHVTEVVKANRILR